MERKKQKNQAGEKALFTWTYKGFNQNLRKKKKTNA
jgi:hypothetical protein